MLTSNAQQTRLVTPIGHTGIINSVVFSPDGKKILTGSSDNTAIIWDAITGKLLAKLSGHLKEVTNVSFSPNGLYIITSSKDETARLWDARTGEFIRSFETSGIHAAFSPDSRRIITSGVLSSRLWDIESGENILDFGGDIEPGTSFNTFSPDGKRVLTLPDPNDEYSNDDDKAALLSTETGESIQILIGHKGIVTVAEFSPGGEKIVTGSDDGGLMIWDGVTGKLLLRPEGHKYEINSVEFSPDGKYFLSGSDDKTAKIWQTATGKLLHNLKGHTDRVIGAHFSTDGVYIVTASSDSTAWVWQVATGKSVGILRGHSRALTAMAISPVNHQVVTSSSDLSTLLWNLKTGNQISQMSGKNIGSSMGLFLPSDSMIFSATSPPVIFNRYHGKIELTLTGITKPRVNTIAYSNDGMKLLTVSDISRARGLIWDIEKAKLVRISYDTAAVIWDALTGKLLHSLQGHEESVKTASFSHDGKKIATGSWDNTAVIWDATTGKLLHHLKGHTQVVRSVSFSPNDSLVATVSWDNSVRIWDVLTGKEQYVLRVWYDYAGGLNSASFSPDGKKIVTAAFGNEYSGHVWKTGDSTITADLLSGGVSLADATSSSASYSHDGKWILTSSPLAIWNPETGKAVRALNGSGRIDLAGFSNDGRMILSVSSNNAIQVWDISGIDPKQEEITTKLEPFATLTGHTDDIHSAVFSHNSLEIISTAADGTSRLWDARSGKLIAIFFGIGKEGQFILTEDGYYKATAQAAKYLHYVTRDLRVINFDQLDVKYNRPDKVLQALGNSDTMLIKSYRKAWEKRIKKLGIDTTTFREGYSAPEADFANRDTISFEQEKGSLTLRIKGMDSTYKLDRFNVWVNETPVFGQRGISIRRKSSNNLDTTIIIRLSQGMNQIETSITNVNGAESYRIPLNVNYTPAVAQKGSLRFIGIGIDQFSDSKNNLQYSTKDIRDLALKLKGKYKEAIIIDTLFNEQVTSENVKALSRKLKQTTENDKVIVSYSGHGLLSKDFDYYLSTYSINFEKPEDNGLPYDELENLLDSIPARKKLMLIDACHSGEVDKDDLVQVESANTNGVKGLKLPAYKKEGQLGLQNSFELMQSLFVNVSKGTGATVISAAAGTQFALERGDLKNGVFTYAILEAIDKYPRLKVSELRRLVSDRVEQLTGGAQKPTSRSEPVSSDWEL